MARALGALVLSTALTLAGASAVEPSPGEPIDGIRCDSVEGSVFHIHQHVALYDHGKPVAIPSDVGRPILAGCFYWVHTHTPDGIVHVESPILRTFTLGEFFDIWGQPLSATAAGPARVRRGEVRAFLDGRRYVGDPRGIELSQHADVVIEAGPPYVRPTPFAGWGAL